MKIIAHRGAWSGDSKLCVPACPKNSLEAFKTAVRFGFGIETDFRDICGKIVISHNPPEADALPAEDFFKILHPGQIVAVNIKADGLADALHHLWTELAPKAVPFAFDMSVPDTLGYAACGFPFFERQSEYEKSVVWPQAAGFWLDGFHSTWFGEADIRTLLDSERPVCIVSPELHGREEHDCWNILEKLARSGRSQNIWLCTDKPFVAAERFGEFL